MARGLSKSFVSRVIIGVTPFRVLITLLITYLLTKSPAPPSRLWRAREFGVYGFVVC